MSATENAAAKIYWRYKNTLHFIDIIALFAYLVFLQFAGASDLFKRAASSLCGNFYAALSVYLVIFNLPFYLLTFPLSLYEGFVLEHRFALSNQTLTAWVKDEMKKGAVSFFVFLVTINIFYLIPRNFPHAWWLIASLVWIGFSVFFVKIFPVAVIPLFYKYKAVTNEALRARILKVAKTIGIKVMDVVEIDLSAKTRKANAALVGCGKTRRIILGDNLTREFTPDEVEVVVAHEMAHHKLMHMWKLVALGGASMAVFFCLLNLTMKEIASMLGRLDAFDISFFPAICIVFSLYELIIMPIKNGISRKLERDADTFALEVTRLRGPFISLMEKLAAKNLSDKSPNRFIEFLFYDHPPISKRIEAARNEADSER